MIAWKYECRDAMSLLTINRLNNQLLIPVWTHLYLQNESESMFSLYRNLSCAECRTRSLSRAASRKPQRLGRTWDPGLMMMMMMLVAMVMMESDRVTSRRSQDDRSASSRQTFSVRFLLPASLLFRLLVSRPTPWCIHTIICRPTYMYLYRIIVVIVRNVDVTNDNSDYSAFKFCS